MTIVLSSHDYTRVYEVIEYTPKPCFWTKFRKRLEVLDEEDRWIRYAKHALELFNHDLMWQGIIEGCKILKYPELSEIHKCYILFGFKCFPKLIEHCLLTILLTVLSVCVCKLKYNSAIYMMYLINHIELKHKTKLQKSRRRTNCVPRGPQSKLSFCKSPVEGHKVP